ncbi:hypothetical protein P154DRAFT_539914 [Amniculicola lignicola CBS 123094]|uniref:DUF7587 domain-containing protein n=1 Tax=Amniculicola lignicola CBS 123094 TaxID=1392246 RepID=A0A6A5VYH1_9PLEO|nr:hypothetical protein P154DRAFT_539914 [Amniculicola lignicola CBS 123094]
MAHHSFVSLCHIAFYVAVFYSNLASASWYRRNAQKTVTLASFQQGSGVAHLLLADDSPEPTQTPRFPNTTAEISMITSPVEPISLISPDPFSTFKSTSISQFFTSIIFTPTTTLPPLPFQICNTSFVTVTERETGAIITLVEEPATVFISPSIEPAIQTIAVIETSYITVQAPISATTITLYGNSSVETVYIAEGDGIIETVTETVTAEASPSLVTRTTTERHIELAPVTLTEVQATTYTETSIVYSTTQETVSFTSTSTEYVSALSVVTSVSTEYQISTTTEFNEVVVTSTEPASTVKEPGPTVTSFAKKQTRTIYSTILLTYSETVTAEPVTRTSVRTATSVSTAFRTETEVKMVTLRASRPQPQDDNTIKEGAFYRVQHRDSATIYYPPPDDPDHFFEARTAFQWEHLSRSRIERHLVGTDRGMPYSPFISVFDNLEDALRRGEILEARGNQGTSIHMISAANLSRRFTRAEMPAINVPVWVDPVNGDDAEHDLWLSMKELGPEMGIDSRLVLKGEWLACGHVLQKRWQKKAQLWEGFSAEKDEEKVLRRMSVGIGALLESIPRPPFTKAVKYFI